MTNKGKLAAINKCFDHLGGRFAPALFKKPQELDWIKPKEGRKIIFEATENG